VMGLADLKRPGDRIAVDVGNALMWFGVRLARCCRSHRVPWSIENPSRSRVWLAPAMIRLSKLQNVQFTITHFCMWGEAWRKATGFLTWGLDMSELARQVCVGAKRGLCARTGARHIQLSGKHPSGIWWTKFAEPYPLRLCTAIARSYYNSVVAERAGVFDVVVRRTS